MPSPIEEEQVGPEAWCAGSLKSDNDDGCLGLRLSGSNINSMWSGGAVADRFEPERVKT